ncbi:MAG: 50S ribosomal protein L1 [Thermoproteota archaeon]|nr:50S ribosomal protein L1 [Thermoproteota archaeon]
MVAETQLKEMVRQAREEAGQRKFSQSVDLTVVLKDIDVKKGFNVNEVITLPHKPSRVATICVVGSGDLGTRARKAQIDKVIEQDELDRLGTNKREARKVVRAYDFFLSDTALMPTVGRSLGQFLGPKGKMPTPLPYGAPIESIATRIRSSVRARAKNQLNISTKIGDEKMDDTKLASNASAVINAIEKKLPQGEKNIRNALIKFTMGKAVKLRSLKEDRG